MSTQLNTRTKSSRRVLGGLLLVVGLCALGYGGAASARARAEREAADAAARVRSEAKAGLAAATETLRSRAIAASALAPLKAALESGVDGATLLDLFQTEEWWQPYRSARLTARVIAEGAALTTLGTLPLGSRDQAIVAEAQRAGSAAAPLFLADRPCLAAAVRVDVRGHKPPILVLAEPMDPKFSAALKPEPAATPDGSRNVLGSMAGGGALMLAGLAMMVFGGNKTSGSQLGRDGAIPEAAPTESTLRFGTPQRAREGVSPGAAAPSAPAASAAAPAVVTASSPAQMVVSVPGGRTGAEMPRVLNVAAPRTDPQIFGRYRLLDRLGEGGMSEVYTAVAYGVEGFSRTFVLKRLKGELARDKEAVAQFFDEAKLQASLVHSNIVPVFDFGKVGDEYFLTQEYIRGRDIVQLLARNYDHSHITLPENVAYHIVYETLQALAYAHQKRDPQGHELGLVHRDVSPANILVSLLGEVKLFDFGIVKANRRRSQTQVGMVKGNANFMSPEQARGHAVDARSDLFSLGLVLYYCLTNRLLYDGENDLDVLYQAATGPSAKDRMLIDALPEPSASILDRALAIDPADRFPDAMSFAAAIEPYARGGKTATAALMRAIFGRELQDDAAA